MQEQIALLNRQFADDLQGASTTGALEIIKVKYLGKKGPVQELMKLLRDVPSDSRPEMGKQVNILKESFTSQYATHYEMIASAEEDTKLSKETQDITLPGRKRFSGRKHIISQVMEEITDILASMGFSVQLGPDIETDFYNFEALNFPPDHPARDMQDTFYVDSGLMLRTHTSNVQVRVMEAVEPPIRVVAPGKVYRNEAVSARSHVFFHQVEAFYIDKGVTFSDLLGTLDSFFGRLFKKKIKTRYRPSYFPFVEPGLEVDIHCLSCEGKGCPLCKYTGWLEVAGAGMIHPEVLKNGSIDPEVYTGYAWGLGVERLVMLKHGIKDIRLFTENDMRFSKQFSGV